MEGKQDAPSAAASSITSIEGDQATSSSPSHSATLNSQTNDAGSTSTTTGTSTATSSATATATLEGLEFADSRPEHVTGDGKNSKSIVCRLCGCAIIEADKAQLVQKPVVLRVSRDESGPNKGQEAVQWLWHLESMFEFENIGFTHTLQNVNSKYLTCADCEVEVVGYQPLDEGDHFYVTSHRVKYQ